MTKTIMLAGVAAFALASVPANAQAPADAAGASDAPADIVVTAQKRSERLQDVPVAVSVVGGDALAKLSTNNIEDTQRLIPTLTFIKGNTTLNSALFLRGIGTTNLSIAAEPSVSTVLDGVVLARAGEAFGDLFDIERIEVLRGPQGTLFGKNASAGVVSVITRQPRDEFEGYLDIGYFDRAEYKVKAGVGGPLGGGWKAGVSAFYGNHDGNIRNLTYNQWVNGYERWGVRGQLVGEIGNLSVRAIADYRKANDDCCSFVVIPNPSQAALPAVFGVLAPFRGDATRENVQNRITRTLETSWGLSLQGDLALGRHTLTSITSYRKFDNTEFRDGSWVSQPYLGVPAAPPPTGAFPLVRDEAPQTSSTFTQELRLTSPTGGFVDYVAGAFFYKADARRTYTRTNTICTASPAAALPSGLTPCPTGSTFATVQGVANFGSTFINYAVFGQATWHFAERLRLTTGLRYTHDNLKVDHIRVTTGLVPAIGSSGIATSSDAGTVAGFLANGVLGAPNGIPWRGETSADNLSGKGSLEYSFSPEHMGYVSYARGYKGPAFNVLFGFSAINTAPIAAELSDSFEAGLKNSMWGGRAVLNLAAYYVKVKNYQSNFPTTIAGAVAATIINAGDVSSRGFEADFLFRPTRSLTVNGGVAYTDAHVDRFRDPPAAMAGNALVPGTPLAFAPKLKGTVGATYTVEPGAMPFGLEFNAQASFQDKQLSTLQATNTPAQVQLFGGLTIPAYEQVDLSIAAVGPDKRWRVAILVKNLFDKSYASWINTGGPGGTLLALYPRDADRYFGVTARVNFGK